MNVMIVDDSTAVRELLRKMLAGIAEVTSECSDGREAVDAYSRTHPDWVIMDIKMKHIDGLRATREILAFDPHARIIIITQDNDDTLANIARRAGAVECVSKENLINVVTIIKNAL